MIRDAHDDRGKYPLAYMCMEIGSKTIAARVAVARRLPVSAISGRDVPEMLQLLEGKTDVVLATTT